MPVELTEALLSNAAGWEAMKRARAYLAQGQVLSSYWAPPLLRGVVQAGEISFRASMVIKSGNDMENLCTCREAREWGKICAHVVAVGLHYLKSLLPPAPADKTGSAPGRTEQSRGLPSKTKTGAARRQADGEPAELFIILPPNLDQALARGKIMLVFEARWAGGRVPLNALPKGRPFSFSPADVNVLERLEEIAGGDAPALVQLDASAFLQLLPALAEHPRITLGKSVGVTISKKPFALPLRAALEANGEITLALRDKPGALQTLGDWVWRPNSFQPLALPGSLKEVLKAPLCISRAQVPFFLGEAWPQLQASGALEANFQPEDFTLKPQAPKFILELEGGLANLSARLQCTYGSRILTLGASAADEAVWLPDPEVPTRYSTRDQSAERAALARLQRCGFSGPDAQGKLQLLGQNAVLNFFARAFPKLEREWTVSMEERLGQSTARNLEHIEPQFRVTSSGVQWFDLGVVFASSSGQTFSPADIQRLLLSGEGHARLKNGKIAVFDTEAIEEFTETLRDCAPQQTGDGFRIGNAQAGFVEATIRQHANWRLEGPANWRERAAKQAGQAAMVCPPLGELDAVLRPYQKQGVAWLHFLRENGFGGLLADEMGLGKTLQTLAFLWSTRQEGERPPALVVCPSSLIFNWEAEARKFTPSLKVLSLHGPARHEQFSRMAEQDLVITSYPLLRRDSERYREVEFDLIVLDEAQHIKNRQTQSAQAVKTLKASQRLVLTGTPLENSVFDLWSIFDFLMPGYLGSAQDFRERYEVPLMRDRDKQVQARLARRLRPFLLRRLKSEVAADLPPKLEQVAYCELTTEQRQVYQQVIEASRKEVLEAVGTQGLARSRMVVLSALLRLRQVCCDLRLLKLEGTDPATASGKLELFGELLEEVLDGGHRVLVFSQFVSMLSLLKERLVAEQVQFCYLDGSTTNRAEVVARFQTDPSVPVFLISLKAGGVGLNLAGADTVVHFDPWWNPAVEAQATDRAHRIGQTRVVTSYKLISRDTVEEKILALQNRKRELLQGAIEGEDQFAAALTWQEIQELLT